MCTTQKLYANTGVVTISTANSNLDGSGTLGSVITGGNTGTIVKQIVIKAQGNTTEGMIRLFIDDGSNTRLIREISIPSNIQTSVEKSTEIVVEDFIMLEPTFILKASTENAETFNIIAFGDDWEQCDCTTNAQACCIEVQKTSNTAIKEVNTANSNLDGTGTLVTLLTSPTTSSLNGGTNINYVNIKATGSTSEGMVRLFIDNGSGSIFLITEISIPESTQSSTQPAYRTTKSLQFNLEAGYSLKASTQVADSFNVLIDAADLENCDCLI